MKVEHRMEDGELTHVVLEDQIEKDAEEVSDEDIWLKKLEAEEEGEKLEKNFVPIIKIDRKKHVVYGIVLEPETYDAQKDIVSAEEIEKAAHEFLAFYRSIDLRHTYVTKRCYPVESYLAPHNMVLGGERVKKGSWVMGTKITDPKIWKAIEDGKITGYSIVGFAQRTLEGRGG